jgi:hypothetical protein
MHRVSYLSVLLATGVFVTSATAEDERDCRTAIAVTGKLRNTIPAAKNHALKMWRERVQAMYGEQWAEIRATSNEQYQCSSAGAGLHKCTLTAKPCRVGEGMGRRGGRSR